MKTAFKPDANTSVIAVKLFKAGEQVTLPTIQQPVLFTTPPPTAPFDLCMVKLLVGPGVPGPASAPSTSPGIGIEAWLPAASAWDRRFRVLGVGGQGAQPGIVVPDSVGAPEALYIAATHGTAAASDDHGHVTTSSFLMLPDGTVNTVGAANWGHLAVHQTADKVKQLIAAYYGSGPDKSYFQGCSGGGRDAYAAAQVHPEDFDGIVAVAPARSWSKFVTGYLTYGPLISQRDLGGVVPTADQQESVRAAAIRSCDSTLNGHHDGYISDPDQCHYDPTKDTSALCTSDGGTNTTAACVTKVQAQAFNKAWYGMTVDGSVPDPQDDLGVGRVVAPNQIAPGFARGAANVLTAAPSFSDFAVVLGNSSLARPSFANATGNGQDGWKSLSYQDLANVVYQSVAMQPYLGLSDADDPDLTKFRDHGGKMISAHGMADQAIPHNNTVDYYLRSSAITGGMAKTAADYHRLYLIPGMNHCGTFFASPTDPYVPTIEPEGGDKTIYQSGGGGLVPKQFFDAVVDWVEKGTVPPGSFIATNKANTNSRPVCAYPKRIAYLGGDINSAASYSCK